MKALRRLTAALTVFLAVAMWFPIGISRDASRPTRECIRITISTATPTFCLPLF